MGCTQSSQRDDYDQLPPARRSIEKAPDQECASATYMAIPAIRNLIESAQLDYAWNAILSSIYPVSAGYTIDAEHWTSGKTGDGHMAHTVRPAGTSFSLAVVECRVPATELSGTESASAFHVASDIVVGWVDDAPARRRLCAVTSVHGAVNLFEWDWDLQELTRINQEPDLWIGRQCATVSAFLCALRNRG